MGDFIASNTPINLPGRLILEKTFGKEATDSLRHPIRDLVAGTLNLPYDVAGDASVLVHKNSGTRDRVGAGVNILLKVFPEDIVGGVAAGGKAVVSRMKPKAPVRPPEVPIGPEAGPGSYYEQRVGAPKVESGSQAVKPKSDPSPFGADVEEVLTKIRDWSTRYLKQVPLKDRQRRLAVGTRRILELSEAGDTTGAVQAAKNVLRLPTNEAHQVVVELQKAQKASGFDPAHPLASIENFVQKARSDPSFQKTLRIGDVSDQAAVRMANDLNIKPIKGRKLNLLSQWIHHDFQRHGTEMHGQVSVTAHDFELIQQVVNEYDKVSWVTETVNGVNRRARSKTGEYLVRFEKRIQNKHFTVFSVIDPSNSNPTGALNFVTMYKHK